LQLIFKGCYLNEYCGCCACEGTLTEARCPACWGDIVQLFRWLSVWDASQLSFHCLGVYWKGAWSMRGRGVDIFSVY